MVGLLHGCETEVREDIMDVYQASSSPHSGQEAERQGGSTEWDLETYPCPDILPSHFWSISFEPIWNPSGAQFSYTKLKN